MRKTHSGEAYYQFVKNGKVIGAARSWTSGFDTKKELKEYILSTESLERGKKIKWYKIDGIKVVM